MDFDGIQPSHISEDLLAYLTVRAFGANGGYEDHLQFGEGEETLLSMYANPTAKWAQGSTKNELQASRAYEAAMASKVLPPSEKFDIRFNLAFYDMVHYFSLPGIIAFILGAFVLGANPFAVLPVSYILVGWGMSQAIGVFSLSQFWERYGYLEGTIKWLHFLFVDGGFFYWTSLIGSQSDGLRKGLKEKGAWVTAAKDQGTESYAWDKLFGIFTLGFITSIPLLSLLVFAPITPWLILVPVGILAMIIIWDATGRKIPFGVIMGLTWAVPLVASLFAFSSGGGIIITTLFYLYVVVSFLVSPFAFNPNPLRLNSEFYQAISQLENGNEPFRKIGTALSKSDNKINRIKVLLIEPDLLLLLRNENRQSAENKDQIAQLLNADGFLTDAEKDDQDLNEFAEYLIALYTILEAYEANMENEILKAHSLVVDEASKGRKALKHLLGWYFTEDLKAKPTLESKKAVVLGGLFKAILVFPYELALIPATLVALSAAVLGRFLLKEGSKPQALAHLVVFMVQKVRVGYRDRINAYIADILDELLRDQEQEFLGGLDLPPAPPALSVGDEPTPTPDAAPSVTTIEIEDEEGTVRIQVDEEDMETSMVIPDEELILDLPQDQEEVQQDDEEEEDQVVSGFAVRKGVRVDRAKLKKEAKEALQTSRTQLVVQGPDHLVIRTGKDQKDPAWIEMFGQAIVYMQQQIQESEELKVYWRKVLSREDNRAPPVYINLVRELDGKTAAVRQVRYIDGKPAEVQILFSEKFITTLLSLYPNNKEVVSWLIGERLFHELGHTNSKKTPDEAFREEISVIRFDLKLNQLTDSLKVNGSPLQDQITTLISQNQLGELFPGFYFLFLQRLARLVDQPEPFETALRDFALSQLAAGEIPGVEQGLSSLEESEALVAKKEAIVAEAIVRKLVIGAQNGVQEAQVIFQKGPIPVEAEAGRLAFVEQLLADKTKEGAILELTQTLIDSSALTFSSYHEILTESGQSVEPDEVVFLTQLEAGLAQAKVDQAARGEALLQGIESLLQANQRKDSPELIVLDSSLLKLFQEDESVLNLLESYQSQVAIVVMREDEKSSLIGLIQQKGFTVTYEGDVDEGSLEHAVLRDVNAKDEKVEFARATVVTVAKSSSKWQWYNDFSYRVIVSKGDSPWSQWLASSAIREVLERTLIERGLTWDEVIKAQEPKATEQEFRLTDNIALISA